MSEFTKAIIAAILVLATAIALSYAFYAMDKYQIVQPQEW